MTQYIFLGAGLVAGGALGAVVFYVSLTGKRKAAQAEAEGLLRSAEKEAKSIKKQAELDGKEALQEEKNRLHQKHQKRMQDVNEKDRKVKEQRNKIDGEWKLIDKRRAEAEALEQEAEQSKERFEKKSEEYTGMLEEIRKRLETVAGMNRDEAKKELVESMVADAKLEANKRILALEENVKEEADTKARNIMALAMQRISSDFAVERTVSVVSIPDDRVKGRIIGREGRNIRAFEHLTGVDLIIDDTPDAVVLSCHSPLRREIARLSLERLIEDGRVHPGRIEEIIRQVSNETEKHIKDQGQKAVFDLGIKKMHPELIRYMGINMFRTSYSQNILAHSVEVGFMCGIMAAELGIDQIKARRAGFLHDIGKAVDKELEGAHAAIGADLCRKYGEQEDVIKAVAQHHDDRPESALGVLVQVADSLSAARPGARREIMTSYISRLEDLEKIASSREGVEKAYAIQAGRELRILVEADRINDEEAFAISSDVAKQIESTMSYPGQIKVTVLRETRAVAYAK